MAIFRLNIVRRGAEGRDFIDVTYEFLNSLRTQQIRAERILQGRWGIIQPIGRRAEAPYAFGIGGFPNLTRLGLAGSRTLRVWDWHLKHFGTLRVRVNLNLMLESVRLEEGILNQREMREAQPHSSYSFRRIL